VVINWGPGEIPTTLTLPLGARTFTATHQYRDDNPTGTASDLYPVTVTVTDDDTGSGTAGTSVTVNNLAPSLGVVTAPTTPQAVHTPVTVGATFTDVGTGDTHTATYDWGDGGSTPGTMSEVSGSGSTAATYAYASAGVYTVRITVTDDDTGASSTTSQYVVVYDPTAGFVTGGGWINSPAGAYTPDPALTGKATFGFVSKYKKGQSTPDGNTTFQFHAASMDFKSTSYEWLVISGARAKYKGVGTINGAGNYGFMLTATDGQVNGGGGVDKFRIKIWDKNNGDRVVYDNQMGAADDSYVGTAISGGSIQIQSGPSMTAAGGAKAGPKPAGLTRAALQPIIREAMRRWNLLGLSPAEQQALRLVTFRVADLQGSTLGTTDGHAVTIDRFAAGYGWFVDRTPGSDSEFTTPGNQGEQGKMDLLTVVMHEIGHVLGRPYTPFGVMAEFLATGTRQNP
jgi:hypothetical protein